MDCGWAFWPRLAQVDQVAAANLKIYFPSEKFRHTFPLESTARAFLRAEISGDESGREPAIVDGGGIGERRAGDATE